MKQSSVEWLIEELEKHHVKIDLKNTVAFNTAKAMHKQEHEDAYIEGGNCISDGWAWTIEGRKDMAGIRYTETFGKSEQ